MAHLTTMTWIYSNIFVVMEMAPAFRLSSLHAGRKTYRQSSASHIHSRELMQTVFISWAKNSYMIFQKVSCQRSSKWISPGWLTKNSCKTEAQRKGRTRYRNKYEIDSYRMDKSVEKTKIQCRKRSLPNSHVLLIHVNEPHLNLTSNVSLLAWNNWMKYTQNEKWLE